MAAAIIPSLMLLVTVARANPQLNVVGEGLMSNPVTSTGPVRNGMRYAGPIVYTNEKPPIIYFPPPPKDAKPGVNFGGGLNFRGKNKKTIKYVPMPHHDLPVLIYTSDKTPPIHVVHPPNNENQSPFQGPPSFRSSKDNFGSSFRSLSSTYSGIVPEGTSSRIVSSSLEIPSTSYGTPMKALEVSSLSPSRENKQQYYSTTSFKPAQTPFSKQLSNTGRPFGGPQNKKPPHIMYSGHPPIHVFNEPDMFVKAPKSVPYKNYEELPPKASFGPPKSPFGLSLGNSFGPSNHHRRPNSPPSYPFTSSHRPRPSYVAENLAVAGSSNTQNYLPSPQNNQVSGPSSSMTYSGGNDGRPSAGHESFSDSPQFSFGPFSVEYGSPAEPFISFSEPEPVGSLSSLYQAANNENGRNGGNGGAPNDDGWISGPPPRDNIEGHIMKENEYLPPPGPQQGNLQSGYKSPGPVHSSVFLPSPHSRPHPHPAFQFGGSKLANLFSSFKLKRGKPKYAIAPKSMHKPPIIIYYGNKPPMHIYQKPETDESIAEASTSSFSVASAESVNNAAGRENNDNLPEAVQSSSSVADNVDLTYEASQNAEVRVTPSNQVNTNEANFQSAAPAFHPMQDRKPAIIQAKPVGIFSSTELQPSIYMARNSLNTIFVSDLSGSGTKALKTFIVRRNEGSVENEARLSVAEATTYRPHYDQSDSIVTNIAQDRISAERLQSRISQEQQKEAIQVPATQVDLADLQLSPEEEERKEENAEESSNELPATTILVAPFSPTKTNEKESASAEQSAKTRQVQVAIIQSPSSFQSLSQAEKEAEEAHADSN